MASTDFSAPVDSLRPRISSAVEQPTTAPEDFPATTKRRAFSVSDRLHRSSSSASAARRAVSSAFSNVSRFMKSVSMESALDADNVASDDDGGLPAPARTRSNTTGSSWKLSRKMPPVAMPTTLKAALRRPKGGKSRRRVNTWHDGHVQYVASKFALHGEDAGAISSYYHIIADGISAPFARSANDDDTHEEEVPPPAKRHSSSIIATELVKCVEDALEDLTNRNKSPLDVSSFQLVMTDAIRATRVKCFQYRESRIATTLCVAYFDRWNSKVHTFTLGDSKCIVVRNGEIVFETTSTLREFNVPCVVNLVHPLEPSDYIVESFDVLQDDICLTFSDGMGDNLYKDDVLALLQRLDEEATPTSPVPSLQEVCDRMVAQSTADSELQKMSHEQDGVAADKQTEPEAEASNDGLVDMVNVTPASCTAGILGDRLTGEPENSNEEDPASSAPRKTLPPFFPFATAAALEYRRRVLKQLGEISVDDNPEFALHVKASAALLEAHDGKNVLDRQVLVSKPNRRPHYSLAQLQRMAQLRVRKPDDVTLFIARFS